MYFHTCGSGYAGRLNHVFDKMGKQIASLNSGSTLPIFLPDGRFAGLSLDSITLSFYSATGSKLWDYKYSDWKITKVEYNDSFFYVSYGSSTRKKVGLNGISVGDEYVPAYTFYRPSTEPYDYKIESSGKITRYTKAGVVVDSRQVGVIKPIFYKDCILTVSRDVYGSTTLVGYNNAFEKVYEISRWGTFFRSGKRKAYHL